MLKRVHNGHFYPTTGSPVTQVLPPHKIWFQQDAHTAVRNLGPTTCCRQNQVHKSRTVCKSRKVYNSITNFNMPPVSKISPRLFGPNDVLQPKLGSQVIQCMIQLIISIDDFNANFNRILNPSFDYVKTRPKMGNFILQLVLQSLRFYHRIHFGCNKTRIPKCDV